MELLKGIAPILNATFHDNGEIDLESFRSQIRYLKKAGVSAVTMFGINSEFFKLTDDETKDFFFAQVDEAHKVGLPAVTSVTQHATKVACEQAKFYEDNGADYLMLLPPYFLKPSAAELTTHMEAVLQAVKIPVVIQYAPEQTNVPIAPEVFKGLFEKYENAKHFKIECSPPGPYITNLLKMTDYKPSILVGNTGFTLIENLERGAYGAMPGAAFSSLYVKVYNDYVAGKKDEAFELHKKLVAMYHLIRQHIAWPLHYEKTIMVERGIIESNFCRFPAYIPNDPYIDALFRKHYAGVQDLMV